MPIVLLAMVDAYDELSLDVTPEFSGIPRNTA
jgi:hypothetical protein